MMDLAVQREQQRRMVAAGPTRRKSPLKSPRRRQNHHPPTAKPNDMSQFLQDSGLGALLQLVLANKQHVPQPAPPPLPLPQFVSDHDIEAQLLAVAQQAHLDDAKHFGMLIVCYSMCPPVYVDILPQCPRIMVMMNYQRGLPPPPLDTVLLHLSE